MWQEWTPEELIGAWTLLEDDWRLVANKRGATRLGFALLVKFLESEAHFPHAWPNMSTATNHNSRWLFPGRLADQPMTPGALRAAGIKMGIDLTPAKRSALRQLVLDAPPPVVADMLGYTYQTVDRHAQAAGSTYSSYAALRSS
jgi:hypothetical protein